ncbi:hypothetical protein K2173_000882 [Erythroxylum novogranatense]|uniref:GDSL esterase/lipase n=1 Tax=Erythroxylum novogranatense TaxID=1862640 RepID=A0AAV8TQA1_9ROSI|nr:hypothetical protein K2173_000882 [Erythroxylum novogranatense]
MKLAKGCYNSCMVVVLVMILIWVNADGVTGSAPQFPAMFVFGDSLVDHGNNNLLIGSFAKANYLPYGIDFSGGPTGRFCNGKTIIDFLGDLVGLPPLPPYTITLIPGSNIHGGINFASAAAGILDETGRNLGDRFNFREQVESFESSLSKLSNQMNEDDLIQYLARSLVVINIGSNDYINNYLLPSIYSTSSIYNSKDYTDLLIRTYTTHIMGLKKLGLRKFVLAAVGPLGCIPNQLASGLAPPGKCVSYVNSLVEMFNMKLRSLVDQLNKNHTSSLFVYGNTYGAFNEILSKPSAYAFTQTDRGCCGIGQNRGQITCLPLAIPCFDRDKYVFWDAYHPTQAFNQIIAQKAYSGSPADCYPVNIQQMARL